MIYWFCLLNVKERLFYDHIIRHWKTNPGTILNQNDKSSTAGI